MGEHSCGKRTFYHLQELVLSLGDIGPNEPCTFIVDRAHHDRNLGIVATGDPLRRPNIEPRPRTSFFLRFPFTCACNNWGQSRSYETKDKRVTDLREQDSKGTTRSPACRPSRPVSLRTAVQLATPASTRASQRSVAGRARAGPATGIVRDLEADEASARRRREAMGRGSCTRESHRVSARAVWPTQKRAYEVGAPESMKAAGREQIAEVSTLRKAGKVPLKKRTTHHLGTIPDRHYKADATRHSSPPPSVRPRRSCPGLLQTGQCGLGSTRAP